MSFVLVQSLNGLSHAASLFLVAAGLTLVFGVTRIPNFAHGSFAMLGAYIAATLIDRAGGRDASAWAYYGAFVASALAVGVLGLLVERVVVRRLIGSTELFQLLATFGVVLIVQDLTLWIWGPEERFVPRAPGLSSSVEFLGETIPQWHFAMIATMPLVWSALHIALTRTPWGLRVRAATQDRDMVAALGIDQRRLFASVMFIGAALAGFGGALLLPTTTANLQMDLNLVVEAFVVVVIGGMGSITGALVGALLIGELHTFGIWLLPQASLVLMFVAMAAVLAIRPLGLFGRTPTRTDRHLVLADTPLAPRMRSQRVWALLVFTAFALLPLFVGEYWRGVAIEMMLFAMFAMSLQWLIGQGGMVSFGHAAYFGLGAYGAAFAMRDAHLAWPLALLCGATLAAIGAALFSTIALRSAGVYFAMLSLAFAQILWSTAVQWGAVTGGDNGIIGIGARALDGLGFYALALALSTATVALMLHVRRSPFGFRVRALRDHPARANSLGIASASTRAIVLVSAGALAGLAGAAMALYKGSVFPTALSIATSVDGLVMLLLGGVQSVVGSVVGAFGYHGLMSELVRRVDGWRLVLGVSILLVVTLLPGGLASAIQRLKRTRS